MAWSHWPYWSAVSASISLLEGSGVAVGGGVGVFVAVGITICVCPAGASVGTLVCGADLVQARARAINKLNIRTKRLEIFIG